MLKEPSVDVEVMRRMTQQVNRFCDFLDLGIIHVVVARLVLMTLLFNLSVLLGFAKYAPRLQANGPSVTSYVLFVLYLYRY